MLAVICLFAAVQQYLVIQEFRDSGLRATAVVDHLYRGARNSKWAVYRFHTSAGLEVTARDMLQMYIKQLHKGDMVTVLYDPEDPHQVTADLGNWTWQGPVIFLCGFIFLAVLGYLIFVKSKPPG